MQGEPTPENCFNKNQTVSGGSASYSTPSTGVTRRPRAESKFTEMQPTAENTSGGQRTGASQQRRGGPRTDGGQRNGRPNRGQKKASSRRGSRQGQTQSNSQTGAVFPPINLSSVRSVPPVAAGSISQTPRVTTGISFKDVLTSRVAVVQGTSEVPRTQRRERIHPTPPRNDATSGGRGCEAKPHLVSPTPHSPAGAPPQTRQDDEVFRHTPISIAISRLENATVVEEGGADLLALSQAVLDGCRLLETPKMIIDMLEVHRQNIRTRRGRRTSGVPPPPPSVSGSTPGAVAAKNTPALVPAGAMAIMARIKDRISTCEDLLIATV